MAPGRLVLIMAAALVVAAFLLRRTSRGLENPPLPNVDWSGWEWENSTPHTTWYN